MLTTPIKPLVDQLLEDAVFHRQSVFVYTDGSWSVNQLENKPIREILPITDFRGGAEKVQSVLTQCGFSRGGMGRVITYMRKQIKAGRAEYADAYDVSERNMLRAAAEIAARQPETVALYQPASVISDPPRQRLRFVVCPEDTTGKGWPDYKDTVLGRLLISANTVLIAHPSDKQEAGLNTAHELVHAFDFCHGKLSDQMRADMYEITTKRIKWATELVKKWHAGEPLDVEDEKAFIGRWKEIKQKCKEQGYPQLQHEGLEIYLKLLNSLCNLDSGGYDTPEKKRYELMPRFEEAARHNGADPFDLNSPSRQLCKLICPELGEFIEQHYLPLLKKEYDKALASGYFSIDNTNTPHLPKPLLVAEMVNLPARRDNDRMFNGGQKEYLSELRDDLLAVKLDDKNFGLQADHLQRQDDILDEMREFYKHALLSQLLPDDQQHQLQQLLAREYEMQSTVQEWQGEPERIKEWHAIIEERKALCQQALQEWSSPLSVETQADIFATKELFYISEAVESAAAGESVHR